MYPSPNGIYPHIPFIAVDLGANMPKRKTRPGDEVIDSIQPNEAMQILHRLAEDPTTRNRIEDLAIECLSSVDVEDVADRVYEELDMIDVHDLWESSGATRHGYVEVTDRAGEMFDEALEPMRDEMERYRGLSMRREETVVLMGMLKGLYDYEAESTSEFKDWATDAPRDRFSNLLKVWQEGCDYPDERREVEDFLRKEVPGWSRELGAGEHSTNEPAARGRDSNDTVR